MPPCSSSPGVQAIGSDFTYEMMAAGVGKMPGIVVPFVQGDTFALPFPDETFDAVVSGFLVRNVVDRVAAFREMARVTKAGGRVACLEIAPPTNALLEPFFRFYFFRIVPLIGGLVSGDRKAYAYLPHSTVEFPPPEALARLMEQAGLSNVVYNEYMINTVAIHVGTKLKNTAQVGARMENLELHGERAALRGNPSFVWRAGQNRRLDMILQWGMRSWQDAQQSGKRS